MRTRIHTAFGHRFLNYPCFSVFIRVLFSEQPHVLLLRPNLRRFHECVYNALDTSAGDPKRSGAFLRVLLERSKERVQHSVLIEAYLRQTDEISLQPGWHRKPGA